MCVTDRNLDGTCILTLSHHTAHIYCLAFSSTTLITGSADTTLKIFSLKNFPRVNCEKTLEGHTEDVTCVQFDTEKVVSGSADGAIRVWCAKSGNCMSILGGGGGPIWSLRFFGNVMLSSAFDERSKLLRWDFGAA